jgi:GNAT superfamily N-acetyltransferase
VARIQLDAALTAFVGIFPPDAPEPTVAELTEQWEGLIARSETDERVAAFAALLPVSVRPGTRPPWGGPSCPAPGAVTSHQAADAAVIGAAVAQPDPAAPGRGHLRSLYVAPPWWGRGVGRSLHDAALAHLRDRGFPEASLWVLERNPVRAVYERLGWRQCADRQTIWPGVEEVRYLIDLGSQRSLRSGRYDP